MLTHLTPISYPSLDTTSATIKTILNKPAREYNEQTADLARSLVGARESLDLCKMRQAEAKRNIKATSLEIAKLAKVPVPDLPAVATQSLERLAKHKAVHHVSVSSEKLVIFMYPLFTDIPPRGVGGLPQRRFLGCYKITVGHTSDSFKIDNLSFPDMRPHWGCSSSHTPCFGSWTQINTCLKKIDMYTLADTLVAYLLSTEDSGAYQSSYSWVIDRNNLFSSEAYGYRGMLVDTLAVFNGGDNDDTTSGGRDLQGTLAKVRLMGDRMEMGRKCVKIKFLYDQNTWVVTPESLTPVEPTNIMFTSVSEINSDSQRSWYDTFTAGGATALDTRGALIAYLDALTQAEANENYPLLAQKITVK